MDALKTLVGRSLEMVCVNSNQVYFHFGPNTYLVVESKYRVSYSKDVQGIIRTVPDISQEVLRPLDRDVVNITSDDIGTLKIEFDGGCSIEVYKDNRGYESYKFVVDDNELLAV